MVAVVAPLVEVVSLHPALSLVSLIPGRCGCRLPRPPLPQLLGPRGPQTVASPLPARRGPMGPPWSPTGGGGRPLRDRSVRGQRPMRAHHAPHDRVLHGPRAGARHVFLGGSELHSLLFLALVAEPDPHHVLLEVEFLSNGGDLLPARSRLHGKVGFERPLFGGRDTRAFPLLEQR